MRETVCLISIRIAKLPEWQKAVVREEPAFDASDLTVILIG